jgi:hypothetical protein
MRKLFPIIIFLSNYIWAQTETVTNISIGANLDFTNQPIVPQQEFSHSQTLYYPDQLQFGGSINEIRYTTAFSNSNFTNSAEWIVKIGMTDVDEFQLGDPFITTGLTEVFNGIFSFSANEIIIPFNTPFYYDGIQNLVIDVQEVGIGYTSSALTGFYGVENFNNAPTRSKISMWGNPGGGGTLYENSYPKTQFIGNLERCIQASFMGNVTNITQTTATLNITPNPAVTTYHFLPYVQNTPQPDVFSSVNGNVINMTNLTPAEHYILVVKTDCDTYSPRLASAYFDTKPNVISIPTVIDFDGNNERNYHMKVGFLGQAYVSNIAAADGTNNGMLFRGALDAVQSNIWSSSDIWNSNTEFLSTVQFIIDLTNNPTQPIFSFKLKQKVESYFRVKINGLVKTWTFTSGVNGDLDFETIVLDLTEYIGQTITLEMEHISKFSGTNLIRTAYVDDIQLKEATCLINSNDYQLTSTENSIHIDVLNGNTLCELAIVPQNTELSDNNWIQVTLPYTIESLQVATAYRVYIRTKCGNMHSAWKEYFISTLPQLITIPYSEPFNNNFFSSFFAPIYNVSSDIYLNTVYNYISLHQKYANKNWVGTNATTEYQAWHDNKDFISGLKFRVNAIDLTTLMMNLQFKMSQYYTPQTSWFRILINGVQLGPSYQATTHNSDPYITINEDLSAFVGGILTVDLQHSGRHTNYVNGGINDESVVTSISFTGTNALAQEGVNDNEILVYPNPINEFLFFSGIKNQMDVRIFSYEGKELQNFIIPNTDENFQISTIDWKPGFYIIELSDQQGVYRKTLMKF